MSVLQLPRTCDIPLNKYIRRLLKQILNRRSGIKEIPDINHTPKLQYKWMDHQISHQIRSIPSTSLVLHPTIFLSVHSRVLNK